MKKRPESVEARFPTKTAREAADAAIDALSMSTPMSEYIDTWFQTYRTAGSIDRREKK